jgi:aspartyl protease family protein
MSFSPSHKSILLELASWLGLALLLAVTLANYDELKTFALHQMGVPAASDAPAPQLAVARTEQSDDNYSSPYEVELDAGRHGHFHAEAEINGRYVPVMVDTGASLVALSYRDAEQAGIYLDKKDYTHRINTANGVARVAPVRLDRVSIGGITIDGVDAVVSEPGRLGGSLLGMSFLGRLESVELRSGKMILKN